MDTNFRKILVAYQVVLTFLNDVKVHAMVEHYHDGDPDTFDSYTPRVGKDYIDNLLMSIRILTAKVGWSDPFANQDSEIVLELRSEIDSLNRRWSEHQQYDNKRFIDLEKQAQQYRNATCELIERLKDEIDQMLRVEVTHAERRGQLKLFQEKLNDLRAQVQRGGYDDIPF